MCIYIYNIEGSGSKFLVGGHIGDSVGDWYWGC